MCNDKEILETVLDALESLKQDVFLLSNAGIFQRIDNILREAQSAKEN